MFACRRCSKYEILVLTLEISQITYQSIISVIRAIHRLYIWWCTYVSVPVAGTISKAAGRLEDTAYIAQIKYLCLNNSRINVLLVITELAFMRFICRCTRPWLGQTPQQQVFFKETFTSHISYQLTKRIYIFERDTYSPASSTKQRCCQIPHHQQQIGITWVQLQHLLR